MLIGKLFSCTSFIMASTIKEIDEIRKIIQKKYLKLKHGEREQDEGLQTFFDPITSLIKQGKVTNVKAENENNTENLEAPHGNMDNKNDESFFSNLKNNKEPIASSSRFDYSNDAEDNFESAEDEEGGTNMNTTGIIYRSKSTSKTNLFHNSMVDSYKKSPSSAKWDSKHGPSVDSRKRIMFGKYPIEFTDSHIIYKKKNYENSRGVLELIFKRLPDNKLITENDRETYTNLYLESGKEITSSRATKYTQFLKNIYSIKYKKGKGITLLSSIDETKINYKYWDNPNELVERLQLLIASRSVGNNSHNNEIVSIIEELRESNIIY